MHDQDQHQDQDQNQYQDQDKDLYNYLYNEQGQANSPQAWPASSLFGHVPSNAWPVRDMLCLKFDQKQDFYQDQYEYG